jgi:transcriptional regulator with XRE-family HTH domain
MDEPNHTAIVFGTLLLRLRKAHSLSQEDLSFDAEVTRVYIGLLEKGRRTPSLKVFNDIARSFHMTSTELMSMFEHDMRAYQDALPKSKPVPPSAPHSSPKSEKEP